ncbi:MAG TPA: Ig-like domain-containing protein, partial [Burkholderiaceae bacterium]|nr:Ig-like domain-containing protein [Burkholderiaceae bacterium]
SDGQGGTDTATVNITVSPAPNLAPDAIDDSGSTAFNTPLTFVPADLLGNDTDPENNPLAITSVQDALHGSVSIVAGNVVFTPTAGYSGPASFTYTVSDGQGGTDTATVNITVSPAPNLAPDATPGSVSGDEDTLLPVSLTGTDADGTVQSVTVTTLPSNGTLFLHDGTTPVTVGTPLSPADAAQLVFKPNPDFNGAAEVVFTVTDNDNLTSAPATFTLDVVPINDPPLAQNDEGTVQASQTRTVDAAEGIILSTSVDAGRDSDPEGDSLTVMQVVAGTGAPSTAVSPAGVTVAGIYGDLLLRSDGSYDYIANRAGSIATGSQADDVFTYEVADGNGGLSTATLTLHVAGEGDTVTADPPTINPLANPLGLSGEYYGYNDFNPNGTNSNRRHGDDRTLGNLDHVSDINAIVNGRNAAFGGGNVVGTTTASNENATDARFTSTAIDYGVTQTVTNTLGTNPNLAAGASIAALNNDNSQLFRLLNRAVGSDAGSLRITQGTGDSDTSGTGPTSGLGKTSDAAIRLTGQAYLAAGMYDIRVTADDGFRLRLGNHDVAIFDGIQSPTTRVYTGVPIDGGMTPLELIYWEQGINAVLRVEFKPSGSPDSGYAILGSQNVPLFSDAHAPALTDLQDIVAGAAPGTYNIRTGSVLDGGGGNDDLTGNAGRDRLIGGLGDDTLNGGGGADLIIGGQGDDQMTGGAGDDVFRWSLGDGGSVTTPAHDVIADFDNRNHAGDVLDLRDLLVGESHAANGVALPASIGLNNAITVTPNEGNLANFLHFSVSGGDTVVEISSTGGFAGGTYNPAAVDQVITLSGMNLVGGFSNDHQVINDLLQRGKLVTD